MSRRHHYGHGRRPAQPTSWTAAVVLKSVPVESNTMWVVSEMGAYSLYYNPVIHDKENMELVCQLIEKNVYETAGPQWEARGGCCRVDYHFFIYAADALGQKFFRENFKETAISQVLVPGSQITLNTHAHIIQNIFCCCKEKGCTIF
ncbi:UNKNOWN [Stylonychia lemnae]|uniref:Uncharacterized protein n=1 Tax=Stylonychia lemnae TaxID=5949 RepID=A0A077ZTP3_STYLE|nr:UNKNOWN [Stylonychia lemnae]|eukprot:CDW72889.1 UNKNOWN [Stylonychia lemnae]